MYKRLQLIVFTFLIPMGLWGQANNTQHSIGISFFGIGHYRPFDGIEGMVPVGQLEYNFLLRPNTIFSGAIGASVLDNYNGQFNPDRSYWLSLSYLHLNNYSKKKKVHLAFGCALDFGSSKFLYAEDYPSSVFWGYYKKLFAGISPQIGLWCKVGNKSFVSPLISLGVGTTFSKIENAPVQGTYTHKRVLLPMGLRIRYSYLLN